MIRDAIVMLTQEPWCYLPEKIGRLTDWQILELYAKPAAKRAEELKRDMELSQHGSRLDSVAPEQNGSLDELEPGSTGHRAWIISEFVNGPFKMSHEKAIQEYEKQLAAWKASEGK